MKTIIPVEAIEKKILLVRGEKVILNSDLAELYKVETRTLIQAVKSNCLSLGNSFKNFHLNSANYITFEGGGLQELLYRADT